MHSEQHLGDMGGKHVHRLEGGPVVENFSVRDALEKLGDATFVEKDCAASVNL